MRNLIAVTAAMVVATGLWGCGASPDAPEATVRDGDSATAAQPPEMNVLILVLDAFRADMASLYGYDKPTTPHLEEWAKRGTVFRRAYSQSTTTNTSVWSFMNGQYPYLSDYLNPLREEDTPLAELMKNAGFATASFSDNPYITTKMGFHRGFDVFEYRPFKGDPIPYEDEEDFQKRIQIIAKNYLRTGDTSKDLMEEAGKWIEGMQDDPWFCYVHVLRPHNPYYAPEPFLSRFIDVDAAVPDHLDSYSHLHAREQMATGIQDVTSEEPESEENIAVVRELYEGSIAYSDHLTHNLLTSLEDSGILENTLVVIMSDHGEAFEEHGKFLHGRTYPYQEQVHVPLVILPPSSLSETESSVDTPVGLVDILPTLKDMFALNVPQELDGQSLLPLIRGEKSEFRAYNYFQNVNPPSVGVLHSEHTMMTHLTPDYTEIVNREVYDLTSDPKEQNNLYTEEQTFDALTTLTDKYVSTRVNKLTFSHVEFSEQEIELMETLGYLH